MNETDPLIAYLATHDAPCPECKYNLRGLRGDSCPERGFGLALQLNSGDESPRGMFWFVGGVWSFLGVAALNLALIVTIVAMYSFPTPWYFWLLPVIGFGFGIIAAIIVAKERFRKWLQSTRGARKAVAATLLWVFVLCNIALSAYVIVRG